MTTELQQQRNLLAFEADLESFAKQLDIDLQTVIRRVVIDLHDRIVMRTPVDSGRARASWGIEQGDVTDYMVGEEADKETRLSKGQATRMAQDQQNKVHGDFDPYVIWWIFNNLPYILALEYGHSGQAPSGMVGIALAEVEAEILGV